MKHDIYAAAWRKIKEIIETVDMDDYEDNDEIINAMYSTVQNFEDMAGNLESEKIMLESVHGNLITPDIEEWKKN